MDRSLFDAAVDYAKNRRRLNGIPSYEQSTDSERAVLLRDERGAMIARLDKEEIRQWSEERSKPPPPPRPSSAELYAVERKLRAAEQDYIGDTLSAVRKTRFMTSEASIFGTIVVVLVGLGCLALFPIQPGIAIAGFLSMAPLIIMNVMVDQLKRQTRLLEILLLRQEKTDVGSADN